MKVPRLLLVLCFFLVSISVRAQVSTWAQGFDRSPNAATARQYLGLGTNGGGSGTVTMFSADNLLGLFDVNVLTPTTTPHLQFTLEQQSPHLVFASPTSGTGPPTFRGLTLADLPPGGGGTVTSFSSGNANPLFTTSVATPTTVPTLSFTLLYTPLDSTASAITTALGATPVQNATHATTADSLTGGAPVLSITNADHAATPPDVSLITSSNAPIPALKGLRSGGNVTLTDNGTSITITAANSAGGASGIDLSQTNMPAFDGATNFYVDFNWPAQVLVATGAICFNYATNWGLDNTSRVAHIYIPPTNYYRPIYLVNSATNWHRQGFPIFGAPTGYGLTLDFQVLGRGDTNVVFNPTFDNSPSGTNWLNVGGFNPTNSQGGCVFWIEASQQLFQDELATFPATDGQLVRSAVDLSRTYGLATNVSTTTFLFARSPVNSPGNIPALNFTQGGPSWLVTSNFTALAQPNWAFMMFYGRGTSLVFLDGSAEGNRFACLPSESPFVSTLLYSGTSLTFTPPNALGWRLFAFEQNNTTSVIRTNGVQAVSGASSTQTPARWTIGSDYPLSSFTGNAYLAELLIYHTNLTLVQLTNVETYFMLKYGIKH